MPHGPSATLATTLLAAATLLLLPAAPAAAIDCVRATQPMEVQVCRDAGLSALDREVQRLVAAARPSLSGRRLESLDETQRAWLLRRGDCRNAVDPRACLLAVHLDRIATLRQHHAGVRGPADQGTSRGPVGFDCGGHTLAATFVTGEPAMVHLRYRGRGYALTRAPDGGEGRYVGAGGAELTRKGNEAAVTLPDRLPLTCRERAG
ncbi:hypothetical protein EDC65_2191 [Stella humosa]|uniref:C-type lysozyme inhibitor domain-containing protein n=1 Tax=Stella humosa TaxID=94 RepID=A0A3N1LYU0_9PROT|nr:MliC family protein [Stella humosa]ROQ00394.1 hypothetical protein EDC65_2191 [Stella humosa]BBK30363.1 hypothetical protein STHU_09970 [Stella humosa]